MKKVGILDIQNGNLHSVQHALRQVGVDAAIVSTAQELAESTALILPGIGHFQHAMVKLTQLELIHPLKEHIQSGKPFLGICLGMQLLAASSEEGHGTGLGIFDQQITALKINDRTTFKVPHSGWNTLDILNDCPLLQGITADDEFFFLHKYCWNSATPEAAAITHYEQHFASVVGSDKCWGVQFHPEKSHEAGLKILQNFVAL